MNKLIIIPITLLIIVGCAKKQALMTPEKLLKETEFVGADPVTENIKVENIAVTPVVETLIEPEPAAVEEIFPEQEDAAEELPEIIEVSEPQTSIQRELDYDQLFPDSIWTEYMTRRGDYLSLIAYKEYNNANEWRRIYQWNREHWEEKGIGPARDNQNFIYPRSAIKIFQAIPFLLSGASNYYKINEKQIALSSSSNITEFTWVQS